MSSTIHSDAASITTSNTDPNAYSGIYVGTTGHLTVTTWRGTVVTFRSVPAGTIVPIRTLKVMATSTANNLVGLK